VRFKEEYHAGLEQEPDSVVIWGLGTHPHNQTYERQELTLNAEVFEEARFRQVCAFPQDVRSRIVWTPPHVSQGVLWGMHMPPQIVKYVQDAGGFAVMQAR
jgi:hypothetical protein